MISAWGNSKHLMNRVCSHGEVFCFFFPWVFPPFPALEGKDGAQLLPQQSLAGPTAWVCQDLDVCFFPAGVPGPVFGFNMLFQKEAAFGNSHRLSPHGFVSLPHQGIAEGLAMVIGLCSGLSGLFLIISCSRFLAHFYLFIKKKKKVLIP